MAKNKDSGNLEFTPEKFSVAFDLYPPVAMMRDNALRLAQDLSAHHAWTDIHLSDASWEFSRKQPGQGQPGGAIRVNVEGREVTIQHRFPSGGLERFETLVDQVLQAIERVAQPQMLLGTTASLQYVVDIGGDAREAILGGLRLPGARDESDKLEVFNRPCRFVGLRLGFPPDRVVSGGSAKAEGPHEQLAHQLTEGGEGPGGPPGVDWAATLTLQSLPDEPSKLSVEVDGRWLAPVPWKDVPQLLGARLKTVEEFLRTKVSEFPKYFPVPTETEEDRWAADARRARLSWMDENAY